MSKNENDHIDPLFRKAANHYHVEFNENDWSNLKERLDKEATRLAAAKYSRRWKYSAGAAGLVLLMLSLFFLLDKDSVKNTRDKGQSTTETESIEESTLKDNDTREGDQNNAQDRPETQQHSLNKNSADRPGNARGTVQNEREAINRNMAVPVTEAPESNAPSAPAVTQNAAQQNTPDPYEVMGPLQANAPRSQPITYRLYGETPQLTATEMKDGLTKTQVLAEQDMANIQTAEGTTTDTVQEAIRSHYRWSIALAVAPDFSMIGLDRYTAPGESFGALLNYHLTNKFYITTGILRSTKKYWGYGSEYKPPEGYWKRNTNGIVPDRISGTCNVLEIPLMVRYNLVGSVKFHVFVSAGVSSYLLTSESYHYKFSSPNPGSKESWSSDQDSRYPFNIGNVSVGYERFILPNLSIGVEPYLKIPLSGMGWTDISLFSTGAYFTLRYHILKKEGRVHKIREHPG